MKIKFKKIGFCSLFTFLFLISASAQWQGTGGNIYYNNGNVAIGTTNPRSRLDVFNAAKAGHLLLSTDDDPNADDSRIDIDFHIRSQNFTVGRIASFYHTSENNGSGGLRFYSRFKGSLIEKMRINSNGNIGIGTTNPKSKLDVFNAGKAGHLLLSTDDDPNADNSRIDIDFHIRSQDCTVGRIASFYHTSENNGSGGLRFYSRFKGSLIEKMRIDSNGNVGIGTIKPSEKLDVRGTIRANEIIVNTLGADFVFADDYRLRPLQEVEQFITENKHLPDIASADSMAENGVGVSELQTKLLQKVEELTLYVIEQAKQMEAKQKQNESLEQRIREIELLVNNQNH